MEGNKTNVNDSATSQAATAPEDQDSPQVPQAKYRKTAICFEWERGGTCKHGDDCRFAHGIDELRNRSRGNGNATLAGQRSSALSSQLASRQNEPASVNEDAQIHRFGSLTERYYTRMVNPTCGGTEGNDVYMFQHSNRLCLIGLAPKHSIISEGKTVTAVKPSEATRAALSSSMSGKKKKGGLLVKHDDEMCSIECEDGTMFTIPFLVEGKLIEWNPILEEAPSACAIHVSAFCHVKSMSTIHKE